MNLNTDILDSAKAYAARYEIPSTIVLGIVRAESSGDIFAMRYEPDYRWLWDVKEGGPIKQINLSGAFPHYPHSTWQTEITGQKTSWGPMQVMGAVAREYGFNGYFPELCSVDLGILYGCKYLARLRDSFIDLHDWAGVVAAYNAGTPKFNNDGTFANQTYVDKVFE
ncbi:MAG: lytic transglycosylase domain-containing protein [Gammaproteobacteria bacterium]|nr:lytic transglycosylase domain-containing protein [Gammaproteobacteria bacterium]